jgi:hypothetical protein
MLLILFVLPGEQKVLLRDHKMGGMSSVNRRFAPPRPSHGHPSGKAAEEVAKKLQHGKANS